MCERERNFRNDVEIPNYKIRKLEGLIKEKEAQEADHVKKVNALKISKERKSDKKKF